MFRPVSLPSHPATIGSAITTSFSSILPEGMCSLPGSTFEGRSPGAEDTIRVGMIDLQDEDRWTELGTSVAWGWQQGCMLQFIPGSASEVIWNDRHG
jgi:hypothetical protein